MVFIHFLACSEIKEKSIPTSKIETIDGLELRWFGVTTLSIRFLDRQWLFDPFFSRPEEGVLEPNETGVRYMADALGTQVDRIFVGHSHYDHILDVNAASEYYGAPVYGSETTCYLVDGEHCETVTHGWQADIDGVQVMAVRTPHWRPDWAGVGGYEVLDSPSSDISTAPNGGVLSYYMVFPEGQRLFFQDSMGGLDVLDGSGANYREHLLFVETNPIDYWLSCGDCLTDADELNSYIDILQPKVVIPIHWDGLMPSLDVTPVWRPDAVWTDTMEAAAIETYAFSEYGERVLLDQL